MAQSREEGGRLPVTVRNSRPAALANEGSPRQARHLGVQARFIQKDESSGFPVFFSPAPPSTSHPQIGPVLFGGAQRFF
jgi:hypothetical protein